MAGTQLATSKGITLKGSTALVSEYFDFSINTILYQRGIYPAETFTRVQEYGLTLLVTTDENLKKYLADVLGQVKSWLLSMTVQKLVLVIRQIDTNEVVERWQFDVQCDKTKMETSEGPPTSQQKNEAEVKKEIKDVIRQITAAVTFLPLLENACSFDVLVYTDKDLAVPEAWSETGAALITNSETVRFRSFNTNVHKVESMVSFQKES